MIIGIDIQLQCVHIHLSILRETYISFGKCLLKKQAKMHLAVAKKLLNPFIHNSQYFRQELCYIKEMLSKFAPSVKPLVL